MRLLLIVMSALVVVFVLWLASVPIFGGKLAIESDRLFWGFYVARDQITVCGPGRSVAIPQPGHSMRLGFLDIDTPY